MDIFSSVFRVVCDRVSAVQEFLGPLARRFDDRKKSIALNFSVNFPFISFVFCFARFSHFFFCWVVCVCARARLLVIVVHADISVPCVYGVCVCVSC